MTTERDTGAESRNPISPRQLGEASLRVMYYPGHEGEFVPLDHELYQPVNYLAMTRDVAERIGAGPVRQLTKPAAEDATRLVEGHLESFAALCALQYYTREEKLRDRVRPGALLQDYRETLEHMLSTGDTLDNAVWQSRIHTDISLRANPDNSWLRERQAKIEAIYRLSGSLASHLEGLYSITHTGLVLRQVDQDYKVRSLASLGSPTKDQILHHFYGEWHEFLSRNFAVGAPVPGMQRNRPLVYAGIEKFQQELADPGPLDPAVICRAFFRYPRTFSARIAALKEQIATGTSYRRRTAAEIEAEQQAEHAVTNPKLREFLERVPGTALAVDSLAEIDEALWGVAASLEFDAREQHGQPQHNVWSKKNEAFSELLKPADFYGRLGEYELIILPVDEKFFNQRFGSVAQRYDITPEDVCRVLVWANMHSTGRRYYDVCTMEVVTYARHARDPKKRKIYQKPRQGMRGANAVVKLEEAAKANYDNATRYALSRVTSAGSPGLGKRH